MKLDKLNEFLDVYIKNQFTYGGKKYAHSGTKEATDCLFDDFGPTWLYGTVAKYTKRYENLKRPRDPFKIACYSFIMWLKRGYHLKETGSSRPINTTVEVKSKYFSVFEKKINTYLEDAVLPENCTIFEIYQLLNGLVKIEYKSTGDIVATINWKDLTEDVLFTIFAIAYNVWREDFGDEKEQDEDVNNEEKYQK